ncbi:hypothetical protein [Nocardiopsis coralli]|nr:hypothetical protein [Nocardiopsis coralli]
MRRPPGRRIRRRRNAGYLASAGLVAASWAAAHLATEAPDITDLVVRVLSTLGLAALVVWGARQAGRIGAVLALLLTWGPLFLVWGAAPGTALTGGAAFFWAAGPVAALALATKVTPSAGVRHHGSYLLSEDFETADAELLRRLQGAIDRVRRSAAVLGEDVGPGREERWLAEQEWSVARSLARCSDLDLDLRDRSGEAVSERVARALEPQRRALRTAREAVEERIRRFEEYARRADAAVITHHELRQCEENERRDDAFLGLLTDTASEAAGPEIGDSGVRALRTALEEQVTRTVDAGRWLLEVAEGRRTHEEEHHGGQMPDPSRPEDGGQQA